MKINERIKKGISALLVMSMMLSCLPMSVRAEVRETTAPTESAAMETDIVPTTGVSVLSEETDMAESEASGAAATALADFEYSISDSSVILTRYTGSDAAVTVADSYSIDGVSYNTVLDTAAVFTGNTAITSVTIGSGVGFKDHTMAFLFYRCHNLVTVDMTGVDTSKVTTMESLFDECKKLTTITGYEEWDTGSLVSMFHTFDQTNALTRVDLSKWDMSKVENTGWCFQQCYATEILLPDNIRTISAGFMNHASKVTGSSFTIPAGVQRIGYAHTFYDFATDSFTEFLVADGNSNYKVVDGILYSADGTELLAIPRGKTFTDGVYTVPEGVTFMGELSFSRNLNITTVVLPDSFVIKSYGVKDPDYIVYEDTGNINVGTNLTMAVYTFVPVANYAVNDTNPNYTAVDGILYSKDKTQVVAIPTQYGRAIVIPEGVTIWNEQAMWNDTEVSNVDNLSNTVNKLLLTAGSISLPSTLMEIEEGQLALINRLASSGSFTVSVAEGNAYFDVVDGKLVESIPSLTATIDTGDAVTIYDSDRDGLYEITNADDLYAFAALVNGGSTTVSAELTGNIVVNAELLDENLKHRYSGRSWTPMGSESVPYNGTFDGNGYTISGLYCSLRGDSIAGLFGWLGSSAVVQELGILDSFIGAEGMTGSIAAVSEGTVKNCFMRASRIASGSLSGGIVPVAWAGTVSGCYADGVLQSEMDTVPIVFVEGTSTVANCCYRESMSSAEVAGTTPVTDFSTGEAAYLLGSDWGQTIGVDSYPVLGGAKVYCGYVDCEATTVTYSNTGLKTKQGHDYVSGKCECGASVVAAITVSGTTAYYATLAEAAAAVSAGQTITVFSDVTVAEGETLAFAAWAELDVGEHTITCNGTVTIGGSDGIIFGNALYYDGGDVTDISGVFDPTYYKAGDGYVTVSSDSDTRITVVMHNATIRSSDGAGIYYGFADLTIRFSGVNHISSSGTVWDGSGIYGIYLNNSGGARDLTLCGENDAVLNITAESTDVGMSAGIYAKAVTITGGTVNVKGGNAATFACAIYGGEDGVTVAEGATLNLSFGSCGENYFAYGAILVSGEGVVNGLAVQMGETATSIIYTAYGSTVLVADFIPMTEESITTTFVVPEDASLTVNKGVTVDLSAMAVEGIDFSGTVINNGTIKLPADFALDDAPKGGTVYIGERFYVWDSENSKWVCGDESLHTGGTATCTELAVCELCGESYGDYAHSFVGESCSICGQPKTYAITYYVYGKGTVEGPKAAAKDETVTLTVTPDTGYIFQRVSAAYTANPGTDYEYGQDIEMTGLSFIMVGTTVSVHTIFKVCDHSGNTNNVSDNGDGTHTFTCSACDLEVTEEHEGQGTCVAPAKCVCGVVCGGLDLTNHDETLGPEGYTDGYCNACQALQPCQGSGTAEDPYLIGNTGNLYWFARKVNSGNTGICGKLTADIVVNENVLASNGSLNAGTYRSWTPIGSYTYLYSGTFDGDGYTISGLYYNNGNSTVAGLFGVISGATICNVGVVDSYFYALSYAGGVVAKVKDGGTVTNCYSNSTVAGTMMIGGIVGELFGTVTGCYNTGKVSGTRHYVGGVVGNNQGTVTNCCYLTGCATGFGITQYGIGSSSGAAVADVEGRTAGYSDFSTGEACYLLNGGVTDGTQAWYQTCGEGMPAFAGKTVYYGYLSCSAEATMEYTNIPVTAERPAHGGSITYTACEDGTTHTAIYACCGDSYNESHSYADGKCEYCAYVCTHPTHGTDGKCTDCGLAAEHTYDDNGFCTVCDGYQSAVLNENVYEISNAGQLYWFAEKVNNGDAAINGKLIDDIVVNENLMDKLTITDGVATVNEGVTLREWTPIGESDAVQYRGNFDGDGHTVSGLYFNDSSVDYVGLIGYAWGVWIRNVGVVDSYLYGKNIIGGVVGYAHSGTIANCYNTGIVVGTKYIGGILGWSYNGTIISNCYNTGAVFGSNMYIGGVAGMNGGALADCYNIGTVTGKLSVGSVVGQNWNSVENCYYLTGSATGYGGSVQYGIGSAGGAAVADVEGCTAGYSDFSTGEVCYLLNGGVTDGTQAFYQTCGEGTPAFAGKTVYYGYTDCQDTEKIYTNYSTVFEDALGHSYNSEGFCINLLADGTTVCDAYEPAVLNGEAYEISNAGQLYWFMEKVNSGDNAINGKLMKDIVVNEGTLSENSTDVRHWTPIGVWNSAEENQIPFNGSFDGNYHTVSGLYMNSGNCMGMFAMIGTEGTVQNLGVVNCYFAYMNARVGPLAFRNDGTVTNCYRLGGTAYGRMVGGLVTSNAGTLSNCYATGSTWTIKTRGGLVVGNSGTITNCYTGCWTTVYYHNEGTIDELTAYKTTDQFASGEVAYLLGEPFGQTIGTDAYPIFNGETVYRMVSAPCVTTIGYTNDPDERLTAAHSFVNGFCTNTLHTGEICDEYEPCTGSGTAEDPYLIANAGNLYWFARQVNDGNTAIHGRLTADIVVNEGTMTAESTDARPWTPIATLGSPYTGTFDGNGYTVSGLYFNDSTVSYVGLFGAIGGTVKYVGVINSYICGDEYIAGVAAYSEYGCILNCYNASFVTGRVAVGGVVGCSLNNASVTNCYNTGTVTGSSVSIGGVVGFNNSSNGTGSDYYFDSTITNCYNTGTVIGGTNFVGSVVGWMLSGTLTNCYYLTGCTTDSSGVVQFGTGYYMEGGTTADVEGCTTGYTDFSTGEVCYLLNSGVTDGTQPYYQTCGEGVPGFDGKTVYYGYTCCYDTEKLYTNHSTVYDEPLSHSYNDNGFCENLRTDTETACGAYEPAVLVTADNYEALGLTEGYVDYYAMANAGQLMWFAEYVNGGNFTACGVLTENINMNGVKWTPIGTETAYTGTFDGRGNTVSNLWQNSGGTNGNRNGLFVTVGSGGVVTDVILDNATIWGASYCGSNGCGGIAIRNAGTISRCMVTNSGLQQGAYEYLGGIAGENSGTIENCAVINCAFTRRWGGSSSGSMGGITQTNNGTVKNCHSYGCSFNNGRSDKAAVVALGTAPENCYYYTTSTVAATYATAMTVDQFSSGEVCYLLNGDQTNIVWKQTVNVELYPVLEGEVVSMGSSEEYPYYNDGIVNVDISWTAMHYTFTPGEVDEETGETTEDAWIVDEGGGTITVTSYGGKMVAVGFTFEATMGGVSGSFDVEKAVLAQGRSVTATLTVTGQPEEAGFVNKQIGTATVTLGKSDWTVGDTVTVYAKDGKDYVSTVAEVTDSKAVLVSNTSFSKNFKPGSVDNIKALVDGPGARWPRLGEAAYWNIVEPWLINTMSVAAGNSDNTYSAYYFDATFSRLFKASYNVLSRSTDFKLSYKNTWIGRYIWDVEFVS